MLTAQEFAQLLAATGQPVVWHRTAAGASTGVRAIVQSTAKAAEAVVNAYGVNGRSFQLAAAPGAKPAKFDKFTDAQGHTFVADTVVEHQSRGSGATTSFTVYCKGN